MIETKRLILRKMVPEDFDALYACMEHTNEASRRTAMSMGMRTVKQYPDPVNEFTCVYRVTRDQWNEMRIVP